MGSPLNKLSVKGFKSISELKDFKLHNLNVLIGGNGAGKSNFIQIFRMLGEMSQKNLSRYVLEHTGADNFLFNGPKETSNIEASFDFESGSSFSEGANQYRFELAPTVDDKFIVSEERKYVTTGWRSYGSPALESRLYDERDESSANGAFHGVGYFVYWAIASWRVYHFHDTGSKAPMRKSEIVDDWKCLRPDASNIAPFLSGMRDGVFKPHYDEIVDAIRLVMPFFDDFILDPLQMGEAEKVKLSWKQKGSDYPMQPYHLSDGSIRFICLATALLQPNPPSTIIIDEPELGLHPYAIEILAELIRSAAERTQVIISTQSPALVNCFEPEDVIVVNREKGASTFKRLNQADLGQWLDEYALGEIWQKNIIAGGPSHE